MGTNEVTLRGMYGKTLHSRSLAALSTLIPTTLTTTRMPDLTGTLASASLMIDRLPVELIDREPTGLLNPVDKDLLVNSVVPAFAPTNYNNDALDHPSYGLVQLL